MSVTRKNNFQSFNKLTILSLQIVIKCQHFINISYSYVYMHMEKLLLFKINTMYLSILNSFFYRFLNARSLSEILGPNGLMFFPKWLLDKQSTL